MTKAFGLVVLLIALILFIWAIRVGILQPKSEARDSKMRTLNIMGALLVFIGALLVR